MVGCMIKIIYGIKWLKELIQNDNSIQNLEITRLVSKSISCDHLDHIYNYLFMASSG